MYDKELNAVHHDDACGLSFDAAIHSVSEDLDHFKEIPEEQFTETPPASREYRTPDNQRLQAIEQETNIGSSFKNASAISKNQGTRNGRSYEIGVEAKDSAIRRETEGGFRLLERRERSRNAGRFFGIEETEQPGSKGRRVSFGKEDNHWARLSQTLERGESCAMSLDDDDYISTGEYDGQESERGDPEITCRYLDHINMLGLNKTTSRLRFLINWLSTSLLQLRLPSMNGKDGAPLVHIYCPKIKYERGAAVAFNVRDRNRGLINPEVVQKLAESHGISLGVGILKSHTDSRHSQTLRLSEPE